MDLEEKVDALKEDKQELIREIDRALEQRDPRDMRGILKQAKEDFA